MVEFTCSPEKRDEIAGFLQTNVRTIDVPTTGRVSVSHGGYGRYTRYDVVQHEYAGGGPGDGGGWGYIEVLEIRNPPDGRWGIVINECTSRKGGTFTEWETLEHAQVAYKDYWGSHQTEEVFLALTGFKRRITCGALTPWFYAIGDEELIGDYAFPEGLQDDPVYRFGRQFVVDEDEGIPAVKSCMGTRFVTRRNDYHPHDTLRYRLVYWDDGSVWDEGESRGAQPRPLEEGEEWVTEAIREFKKFLAGRSREFTINFLDGHKFVGKLARPNSQSPCAEGDYQLVVHLKDDKKPKEGWVNGFKPTTEEPNIVQFVTSRYAKKGEEVERIEIKKCKVKGNGKKWAGVFFSLP